jgi:hypothetical protein
MVSVDELIREMNDPVLVARAAEEARKIAVIAEANYRADLNRMNNELHYLQIRHQRARRVYTY